MKMNTESALQKEKNNIRQSQKVIGIKMISLILIVFLVLSIVSIFVLCVLTSQKKHRQCISAFNEQKTLRVAMCFFGLTRNTLKITLPSIRNIIQAIKQSGALVETFLHTYSLKHIKYNKTGENQKLDTNEYTKLQCDHVLVTDQNEFIKTLNQKDYLKHGDPYGFGWSSVCNNLCQLNSLKEVTAMWNAQNFDVVMYLRPDLLYSKFDVSFLNLVAKENILLTPNWHKWGGFNDRIAIGPADLMKIYGNRLDGAKKYAENYKFHSESYLMHTIKSRKVKHSSILSLKGKRVRANGKIKELDIELF